MNQPPGFRPLSRQADSVLELTDKGISEPGSLFLVETNCLQVFGLCFGKEAVIKFGKPPALPGDSRRFDLYGGRRGRMRAAEFTPSP